MGGDLHQKKTVSTKSTKRKAKIGKKAQEADAPTDATAALALITGNDITKSVKMDLTKDDLVSYQVVQIEKQLNIEIAKKKKEIDCLRANMETVSKARRDSIEKLIADAYAKDIDAIVKAFAALGIVMKVSARMTDYYDCTSRGELKSMTEKEQEKYIFSNLCVSSDNDHNYDRRGLKPIKKTAEILKSEEESDKLTNEMKEVTTIYNELQYKVSNIDKLERHAKAQFVENILKGSAEGKTILGVATKTDE